MRLSETYDVLLRRQHTLFLPERPNGEPVDAALVRDLEQRMAALGYLLDGELRTKLADLNRRQLVAVGRVTLQVLAEASGDHVAHVPLFREFPAGTPLDTDGLYIERVLRWLLQEGDAPCLVCGKDAVNALDPCGHLVCAFCFDGSNYSGCPICHRRINP